MAKGEGGGRRLDNITNSMDINLSQLQEIVEDRETWHAIVHEVEKSQTWLSNWTTITSSLFSQNLHIRRRRQWHPTPVLLPGKSHGWRSLVGACSPWGREESDTTEGLPFHFSLSYIGEGNGNPLQCSYLENPRNGGAWWAAVYGVAQSRTQLEWLSSSSSSSHIRGFLGGSVVKNPHVNAGFSGLIPGREDPLEKRMATHSSILAWRIPWTEEPGGL